jgi:hypothetical protein
MPGGRSAFIELKTMTGRLSPLQVYTLGKLNGLGFRALEIRSVKEFKEIK